MPFSKYHLATLFILLISFNTYAQNQDSITAKINYYQNKVGKYLDKSKALQPHYTINKTGISIYASAQDKTNNKPEFFIKWEQVDYFVEGLKTWTADSAFSIYKSGSLNGHLTNVDPLYLLGTANPNKRLQGYKIAIDPGHIAHNLAMGKIEQKCLNFSDSICITEGVLTFATATLLKNKLEAEGAEVFMTRAADSICAYGITFDHYMKKKTIDSLYALHELTLNQRNILLNPTVSKQEKFRQAFKHVELAKRASIINQFQPDFTVIIHFNVDETNAGWTKSSHRNFNMCFVAGAFQRSDLATVEKRFEFLRLLISNDLENSIALSTIMMHHFEKTLNVKTATSQDATYLNSCIAANNEGVYCRNLQLTRMVHGPLVYGETLYQDNHTECSLLNAETDKCKNQRIQQVAEAYFQGVLQYAEQQIGEIIIK
jgi:N-acetylmuramoyl-L-alanine amidase